MSIFFMSNNNNDNRIIFSIVRITISIISIVICFVLLFNIYNFVIHYPFLENIKIKNNTPSIQITVDSPNSDSIFITDEKGLRFRKEDKSFAREEWIEKNAELFYFDTNSYGLDGDMRLDGQIYTFEKGKLKKIERDRTYSAAVNKELFNSIDSPQYLVYLDNQENENGAFPIKYHRYSDDIEDYLGTKDDKQYCTTNMLKINISNIYFLALSGKTSYKNKLYRMRPNAETKETVGNNVLGYIVLSDDVVYYYDGNVILKAKTWEKENVKFINEEDMFNDAMNSVPIALDDDIIPIDNNIQNENDNKIEINNEPKVSTKSNINNDTNNNDKNKNEVKIVDSPNMNDINISPGSTNKITINDNSDGPKIKKDIQDPLPLPIN